MAKPTTKKPPYQEVNDNPGTALAEVPTASSPATDLPISDTNGNLPPEAVTTPANGNRARPSAKKRPLVSFRCRVDRTTSLQASVWGHETVYEGGEIGVHYAIMLSRSWYEEEKKLWHDSGKDEAGNSRAFSYRNHELPVLRFLIDKCYAWCMNQRTATS